MLAQMLNHMPGIARRTENYSGLARMQPVEAKKVQPVNRGDTAFCIWKAELVKNREINPREIKSKPGGPDYGPHPRLPQVELARRNRVVANIAAKIRIPRHRAAEHRSRFRE